MPAPFVLFCSDPSHSRSVDSVYEPERAAVESVGGHWSLFSFEALVDQAAPEKALQRFEARASSALYRGWMMSPQRYRLLFDALRQRGVTQVNTPEQYQHCHWFPDSYEVIAPLTPKSVWLPPGVTELSEVMKALAPFRDRPLVLKDYVKSRKHEWAEACFIPSASDRDTVARVVGRFLELQGEDLAGGLVFREFVRFAPLATHSKSGMPLSKEFRLFFLDGALLQSAPYWEEGPADGGAVPELAPFLEVAKRVRSRFFTMDVAQLEGGGWTIVELGDAQVAGLPERLAAGEFYRSLAKSWREAPATGAPGALTR
ncbi:MAG: ATP-grasp domain-containing protein [Myxococcales bacterium]